MSARIKLGALSLVVSAVVYATMYTVLGLTPKQLIGVIALSWAAMIASFLIRLVVYKPEHSVELIKKLSGAE